MKAKDVIIIILLLVITLLGSQICIQRASQQKEAKFRLMSDKAMYEAAKQGDLKKIQSTFSIFLLSDVRDYERQFGVPNGTNHFTHDFAEAQIMASNIESKLVPISSIATNNAIVSKFGSNVTIKVESQ
jgi:hypothetical protein